MTKGKRSRPKRVISVGSDHSMDHCKSSETTLLRNLLSNALSNSSTESRVVCNDYFLTCQSTVVPKFKGRQLTVVFLHDPTAVSSTCVTAQHVTAVYTHQPPEGFWHQRKGAMQCALYSLWHYFGRRDIITLDDMRCQVMSMHNKEWLPSRVQHMMDWADLYEEDDDVLSKSDFKGELESLRVGKLTGHWTMNVIAGVLGKRTNLLPKRLNRSHSFPVQRELVEMYVDTHPRILMNLKFFESGEWRFHSITICNGLVYDCDLKAPYEFNRDFRFGDVMNCYILDQKNL